MANGFFLGGAAEGAMGAQKQALAERTLEADTGLRTRGLDLQERQFANTQQQQAAAEADKQIANTMAVVSETIKNATAVGRNPDQIMRAVTPLVQSAQAIAARVGRDPNALAAQVQAQITAPGMAETAAAGGRAQGIQSGTKIVTEREILERNGLPGGMITDPVKRIEAENTLRDDFTAQSKTFNVVRDYYQSIKEAEPTAAGDLTVIFGFMKLLDPNSNVMPGEQATVQNTTAVSDKYRTMYNSLLTGKTRALGEDARRDVIAQADKIFQGRATEYDRMTQTYAGLAKRSGVNPNNVILDRRPAAASPDTTVPVGTTAGSTTTRRGNIPPPPAGFNVVP